MWNWWEKAICGYVYIHAYVYDYVYVYYVSVDFYIKELAVAVAVFGLDCICLLMTNVLQDILAFLHK